MKKIIFKTTKKTTTDNQENHQNPLNQGSDNQHQLQNHPNPKTNTNLKTQQIRKIPTIL